MATIHVDGQPLLKIGKTSRVAERYSRSWVDAVTGWVKRLPMPAWVAYAALGLALLLLEAVTKWLDGAYRIGTMLPFHVVFALSTPYVFASWHYITEAAGTALERFRPALRHGDAQFNDLRNQLTVAPAFPTLLAGIASSVIGTAVYGLFSLWPPSPEEAGLGSSFLSAHLKFGTSSLALWIDFVLIAAMYASLGAVTYSVFHVLRTVSRIYTQHAHIDIVKAGSLYSLSWLTARIALIMLFGTYGWYLTDPAPGGAGSPWGLWLTANVLGYVILSILAFIWPLLGVHRVLDAQRSQLLEANMEKVRLAATETHRLLTSREYDGMAPLKNAMDSLAAERTNLRELSTWPWQVETVRLVSTAVFLPIVVYLLEKVLLVLLGG